MSTAVQPKSLQHYLNQEEPRLLNHLKITGALAQLPYNPWFNRCFAGTLPESSLQRYVCLWALIQYRHVFEGYSLGLGIARYLTIN